MRLFTIALLFAVLGACSEPAFIGDAPPIRVTSKTPSHFELPARFAVARIVYGRVQPAGAKEATLWKDLANRSSSIGTFAPLINADARHRYANKKQLIQTARDQRYNYVLLLHMFPETGSVDIVLVHVGSGGVMATAQAVSPAGGQRGFWGGQIRNPARLERVTQRIAKAAEPATEKMLRGVALRQR